jgi:hypothetical protein
MSKLITAILAAAVFLCAASQAPELKVEDVKKEAKTEKQEPAAQKEVQKQKKTDVQVKDAVPSKEFLTGMKEVGEIDFRLGDLNVKNRTRSASLDEEDKVFEKDTLLTGKESRCEIKLADGSVLRLSESTKYVIDRFEQSGEKVNFQGYLVSGESWTNVNRADSKTKDFKVKSPIAVAAVIGTAYKMTADGKITEISVLDGKVDVDLEQEKKAELKIEPKKDSGSMVPKQSMAPKQIPGPYEVTLSEWISIVKGEKISIRNDGKYSKTKTDINILTREWESFRNK